MSLNDVFYTIKPVIPRTLQIAARRIIAKRKLVFHRATWPIDHSAGTPPRGWQGWPEGKKFALVLNHDVDTPAGYAKCLRLMNVDRRRGFRSCFYFVPEDYAVAPELRRTIADAGFEVGIHGLRHDGKMFRSRRIFDARATRVNMYLSDWGVVGFSSPSMHRNLDWIGGLDVAYDISTFDTDPFEPQPEGVRTIFPFWIPRGSGQTGIVELPYTLPQDHCLYVIFEHTDNRIWREKLDWIAARGGMALLNAHPDYMNFDGGRRALEEYPVEYYEDFLQYVSRRYAGQYWQPLSREVAAFWATQSFARGHAAHIISSLKRRKVRPRGCIENTRSRQPRTGDDLDGTRRSRDRGLPRGARHANRACIVAKYSYLIDTRTRQQAESLARHGIHVDVLCLRAPKEPTTSTYGLITAHRVLRQGSKETLLKYVVVTGCFAFRVFNVLWRVLFRRPYDVVIVHTLPEYLVFVAAIEKLCKTRVLLDARDLSLELFACKWGMGIGRLALPALRFLERASTRFSDHVFVASPGFRARLVERGTPLEKTTLLVNSADHGIFTYWAARPFHEITRDAKLLYHGSVTERFGLMTAIDALSLLQDRVPGSQLHIYGSYDSAYTSKLRQRIAERGLAKLVFLNPVRPQEHIAQIIRQMDLGVVPYIKNDFMTLALSTKTFEYAAAGLPIVASRLESMAAIFDDTMINYVEPGDAAALADGIAEACRNPGQRKRKATAAFEASTTVSSEVMANRFVDVVAHLAGWPVGTCGSERARMGAEP